jgi:uncharacterized protein YprB with RNaseH-like and TPR domain
MLKNTFCHLPGIGLKTESRLWDESILSWDDFLRSSEPPSHSRRFLLKDIVRDSRRRLANKDAAFFIETLPSSEHWRLYPHFRSSTAYIDIETNGLMGPGSYITTIALYDGAEVRYYVKGHNLHRFPAEISKYKIIVTYNGKCFDVPFIESYFGISINQAHIDLRYIMHSLGFRGGLKGCEKQLGIDRGTLDGLDGFFAVLLWRDYQRSGNRLTLDTLLAYNVQDAVNLEHLMISAYNLKLGNTPFSQKLALKLRPSPELPFEPDQGTIERILGEEYRYFAGAIQAEA